GVEVRAVVAGVEVGAALGTGGVGRDVLGQDALLAAAVAAEDRRGRRPEPPAARPLLLLMRRSAAARRPVPIAGVLVATDAVLAVVGHGPASSTSTASTD